MLVTNIWASRMERFLLLSMFSPNHYVLCESSPPPSLSLTVLHKNKLTHTDLKPENILSIDSQYDIEYSPILVRKRIPLPHARCEHPELYGWLYARVL